MRSHILVAIAAASVFAIGGCSSEAGGDDNSGSEDQLRADAVKVLAKDRAYPDDLVFAGGKLYWSESHMVASGDPELDQQFAYWTGEFLSFNVSHSRDPKEIANLGSPLRQATVVGDEVFFTLDSGVSKSSLANLDSGSWTSVYADYEHFPINEEESVEASALDGDRIYVLRSPGQIVSVKKDGSDYKQHLESRGYAGNLAVASGTAFWATPGDQPYERILWKASVTDASPQPAEVARNHEGFASMTVDGDALLYGVQAKHDQAGSGAIMRVKLSGGAPEVVVGGLDAVSKIALDGETVLFTGKKGTAEGLFTVKKAELGAAAQPKKLYTLKSAAAILPTADALFLSSSHVDGHNRYDGSVVRIDRSGL